MSIAPVFTPPTLALPEYTYKVPESAREWPTDPKSLTIRSFTVMTEMDAINAAGGGNSTAYELLQRCVIKVDGKPVDQGFDLLKDWSPKVRTLGARAINTLFIPDEDETKAFLGSREVRVP